MMGKAQHFSRAARLHHTRLGIILGLVAGKPIGIFLFSFAAVTLGLCRLPFDLAWRHILGAGLLGGIGFTMSIFITNLAFAGQGGIVNASKIAILIASLIAGLLGFIWLKLQGGPLADDPNTDERTKNGVFDDWVHAAKTAAQISGVVCP